MLDFNSTKNFRDFLLSKNLKSDNGPQSFNELNYSYQNLSNFSVNDLPDVTNDRNEQLFNNKKNNIFKPIEYFVHENINTLPLTDNLQLYPYFTPKKADKLISFFSNDSFETDSKLMRFASDYISNDSNGPIKSRIRQNLERFGGRVRILDAINGNDATALNILSGKENLIEKDYQITVKDGVLGKTYDFLKTVTGVQLPYDEINGNYFSTPNIQNRNIPNTEIGKVIQDISGNIGNMFGIERLNIPSRKPSDLFIENTGSGTKSILFNLLSYSKYSPNYTTKAKSQNVSKLFGAIDDATQTFKNAIGIEAPEGISYIGDDRNNNIAFATTDFNDNYVRSPYYISLAFDETATKLFGKDKNIEDGGSLSGPLTWYSKSINKFGENNKEYNREESLFLNSLSTNFNFKEGSILYKTQEILNSKPTGGSAFNHAAQSIDQTSRIYSDGDKLISKGSAIKYVDKFNEERGVEYCRVWTKDNSYSSYSDTMRRTGLLRKIDSSVLNKVWNLNIAPMSDGNKGFDNSTNIFKSSNDNFYAKKYMFSIENLSWKNTNTNGISYNDLPYSERGPNGGRIMWFAPYDLKFSEQSSAKWDENAILGRPEPIYTYQNTNREGTFSFKIIVDHSSILNLLVREHFKDMSDEESTNYLNAFFAGCEELSFYDLITKYNTLNSSDIAILKSYLNSNKEIDTKQINVNPQPKLIVNPSQTGLNNSEQTIDIIGNFYFDNNYPLITNDKITSTQPYNELFDIYKIKKQGYNQRLETQLNSLIVSNNGTEKKYIFNKTNADSNDVTIQKNKLNNNFDKMINDYQNYSTQIDSLKNSLLENKVKEINIILNSFTSASGEENLNSYLSLRRNYSIILDLFNRISNTKKPSIKWKNFNEVKENDYNEFTYVYNLKDFGYDNDGVLKIKSVSLGEKRDECINKEFTTFTDLNYTSPICFDCRQGNIKISYVKRNINPIDPTKSSISNIEYINENNSMYNQNDDIALMNKKPPLDMVKKIAMKVLNESYYFKKVEEDTPLVFSSLKEKLKYFHPSFHSTTPEMLNSRLTFLQQCLRPSNTIPNKNIKNSIRNTTFGAPPICIIRVGDFYNSKVIIRNINFSYEDSPLDLNPEGIGVQPMIVSVNMQLSFIGGQGMEKPIELLQNSLSYNFYANTEVYEDKSISTLTKIDNKDAEIFSKEILENIIKETTKKENINNNDDIIKGKYIGELTDNELDYTNLINQNILLTNNYFDKLSFLYNKIMNEYGDFLAPLLLSYNYRTINQYDFYKNSSNGYDTYKLFGTYSKQNNLSYYKRILINQVNNIFKTNNIIDILDLKNRFTNSEMTNIDLLVKNDILNLLNDKLNNLDNISILNDFEKTVRNKLINSFDNLNFLIKFNHDVIYDNNKFYKVDLVGYNYDLIYNKITNNISVINYNQNKIEDKLTNVNYDNITIENIRNIMKVLLVDKKSNILNLFQKDITIYNGRNKNIIDNFFDKFFINDSSYEINFKKLKTNDYKDVNFTINSKTEITDNDKINEIKLLFQENYKNNSNKLNYYK